MNRITRLVEDSSPGQVRGSGHRTPLALILGSVLAAGGLTSIESVDASIPSPVVQERDRGEERGRDSARGQDRDERRGERRGERRERGDDRAFPGTEEVMERASMAFEEGHITGEQFSGIMEIHERFAMAIESGRMSAADAARAFFERVDWVVDEDRPDERDEPVDEVASRIGMMMIELGMAVESGEISPEDAIRKVMELARRMRVETTPEHAPADQRRARAAYAEAAGKMREMVEAGEITREQMEERLEQMKRRMAMASGDERKPSSREAEFEAAFEKMRRMVEAGEITREQMEERLEQMRRRMAMASGDDGKSGLSEADYEAAFEKMREMVEAGEITREQMKRRLEEMKRSMVVDDDRGPGMTKTEYDEAVELMVEMVKAGKMTREQMQERLEAMNSRMKESGRKSTSKGMTRADFDAAVEKMAAMVEAGEISRKDMETRLAEMKRMMMEDGSDSKSKSRKGVEDDDQRKRREERLFRSRLEAAIDQGIITPEEAVEKLEDFRRGQGD